MNFTVKKYLSILNSNNKVKETKQVLFPADVRRVEFYKTNSFLIEVS